MTDQDLNFRNLASNSGICMFMTDALSLASLAIASAGIPVLR